MTGAATWLRRRGRGFRGLLLHLFVKIDIIGLRLLTWSISRVRLDRRRGRGGIEEELTKIL
jgi:hypothetical protein